MDGTFPIYDPLDKLGPDRPREARPPTEPSAEWTLSQFYAAWVRDSLGIAKDSRTDEEYVLSLKLWAQATGDPPIREITARTFSRFVGKLKLRRKRNGEPLSSSTVHKHWAAIQRLLDRTGPATHRSRDAAGLVEQSVYLKPPKKSLTPKKPHTLETIHRLLEVCWEAPSTEMIEQDVAASVWWRGLILWMYNTGQRIGTAMSVQWESLDDRWLLIRPGQIKGGRGLDIYLNDPAMEAIEVLRRPTGRIFAWRNWPVSKNTLHAHLRGLESLAGLHGFAFGGLRRAFAVECSLLNPMVAQIMMNHRGGGTHLMREHYIGGRPRILAPVLDRLPQPGRAVQRSLFEKHDSSL